MLVAFTALGGETVYVESTMVASLTPVPSNLLPSGVPDATYCNEGGGPERVAVRGTVAATAAALGTGGAMVDAGQYDPAYVVDGDIDSAFGALRWQAVNGWVRVFGAVSVSMNVSPGSGNVTLDVPPGGPQSLVNSVTGVGTLLNDAARDGVISVAMSFVDPSTVRLDAVQAFDGSTLVVYWVDFSYQRA